MFKVGNNVIVLEKITDSGVLWVGEMNSTVGKKMQVIGISPRAVQLSNRWWYPPKSLALLGDDNV